MEVVISATLPGRAGLAPRAPRRPCRPCRYNIANHLAGRRGLEPWPACGTLGKCAGQPHDAGQGNQGTEHSGARTARPGDTLAGIAATTHIVDGWPALFDLNRQPVGGNPDQIRRGEILRLHR